MALVLDANLSRRLVGRLSEVYPGMDHVAFAGLGAADDAEIWDFAAARGLAIVSKDGDFRQRALVYGPPPKVIWLRVGNAGTDAIEALLRARASDVRVFLADADGALLVIDRADGG